MLLIVLLKQARPLSQILRICQLPQRGSPWQSTRTSSFCQGLSLWERWHGVSRDGEGEDASRNAALSQKAALQMPLAVTTPPVKMRLERSAERDKREIINNSFR